MSSLLTEGDLTHEEHVVWLEDPDHLDYVRQALDKTRRRNTKPPYARDGRMVNAAGRRGFRGAVYALNRQTAGG